MSAFSRIKKRLKGTSDLSRVGDLEKLSTDQLMALMRHEAHRIEKTIYNDILEEKYPVYREKWERVQRIHEILQARGVPRDEPTVSWARDICGAFDDLEEKFIKPRSAPAPELEPEATGSFEALVTAGIRWPR